MPDTQTDVVAVLEARINGNASKWWEQMWAWTSAHTNVDRGLFDTTPNGVVYNANPDLGLVLSDFTFSALDSTKATEIIGSKNFQNGGNATITDNFTYSTTKTEFLRPEIYRGPESRAQGPK